MIALQVAMGNDDRRSLRSGFDAELLFCTFDVKMHRGVRNTENLANVGIGFTLKHPPHTLDLARRQQHRRSAGFASAAQLATTLMREQRRHMQGMALEAIVEGVVGDADAEAEVAARMV